MIILSKVYLVLFNTTCHFFSSIGPMESNELVRVKRTLLHGTLRMRDGHLQSEQVRMRIQHGCNKGFSLFRFVQKIPSADKC